MVLTTLRVSCQTHVRSVVSSNGSLSGRLGFFMDLSVSTISIDADAILCELGNDYVNGPNGEMSAEKIKAKLSLPADLHICAISIRTSCGGGGLVSRAKARAIMAQALGLSYSVGDGLEIDSEPGWSGHAGAFEFPWMLMFRVAACVASHGVSLSSP